MQNYVQGGRILIKHQAVALRLADMATRIEAVRALDGAGVETRGLALRRPSLDDVLLGLTGHAAEEEEPGGRRRGRRGGRGRARGGGQSKDMERTAS